MAVSTTNNTVTEACFSQQEARSYFTHVLPPTRLGQEHDTLKAYREASNFSASAHKEYSLIVVTEAASKRILLGKKHRGFGMGMFNSFGGKLEAGETPAESAVRELEEETGICVQLQQMEHSRLGTLRFSFEDSPMEMLVYLFRIDVCCKDKAAKLTDDSSTSIPLDPATIRGCDEITPVWFADWCEIPLDNMFADDSVWLTQLLSLPVSSVLVDGWFHFHHGGQAVNSIQHFHVDIRPQSSIASTTNSNSNSKVKSTYNLEQRLFHAIHNNRIHSPSIKEFNEAFGFCKAVNKTIPKQNLDVVIDVAGGHGALAALFLITTTAGTAVVVDPNPVGGGGGGISKAWGNFLCNKELLYRRECLRTGLPAELDAALRTTTANRILVVACHACQHLSDEIMEISCRYGVHAAVMPCCQKDPTPGSPWKATSKRLGVPIEKIMDLLLAGKAMSWTTGAHAKVSYEVRMKVVDGSVTPQNRLIICRASALGNENARLQYIEKAHSRLSKAYKRAHALTVDPVKPLSYRPVVHLAAGFAMGFVVALAVTKR